jgi:hypothetical protein
MGIGFTRCELCGTRDDLCVTRIIDDELNNSHGSIRLCRTCFRMLVKSKSDNGEDISYWKYTCGCNGWDDIFDLF